MGKRLETYIDILTEEPYIFPQTLFNSTIKNVLREFQNNNKVDEFIEFLTYVNTEDLDLKFNNSFFNFIHDSLCYSLRSSFIFEMIRFKEHIVRFKKIFLNFMKRFDYDGRIFDYVLVTGLESFFGVKYRNNLVILAHVSDDLDFRKLLFLAKHFSNNDFESFISKNSGFVFDNETFYDFFFKNISTDLTLSELKYLFEEVDFIDQYDIISIFSEMKIFGLGFDKIKPIIDESMMFLWYLFKKESFVDYKQAIFDDLVDLLISFGFFYKFHFDLLEELSSFYPHLFKEILSTDIRMILLSNFYYRIYSNRDKFFSIIDDMKKNEFKKIAYLLSSFKDDIFYYRSKISLPEDLDRIFLSTVLVNSMMGRVEVCRDDSINLEDVVKFNNFIWDVFQRCSDKGKLFVYKLVHFIKEYVLHRDGGVFLSCILNRNNFPKVFEKISNLEIDDLFLFFKCISTIIGSHIGRDIKKEIMDGFILCYINEDVNSKLSRFLKELKKFLNLVEKKGIEISFGVNVAEFIFSNKRKELSKIVKLV